MVCFQTSPRHSTSLTDNHKCFVENTLLSFFSHHRYRFLMFRVTEPSIFFPQGYIKYDRLDIIGVDNFSHKVFSHCSLLAADWGHLLRFHSVDSIHEIFSSHNTVSCLVFLSVRFFNETLIHLG